MMKRRVLCTSIGTVVQVGSQFREGAKVLVLTPAEYEVQLAEARAEVAAELVAALKRAIACARVLIYNITYDWAELSSIGADNVWWFGFRYSNGRGGQWCADHNIDRAVLNADPQKAMDMFLAAVRAAQKPVADMTDEEIELSLLTIIAKRGGGRLIMGCGVKRLWRATARSRQGDTSTEGDTPQLARRALLTKLREEA